MAMFETPPPPGFEWAGASEGAGEHTADEHHARPKTYTVAELRRQGERAIAQREAWQPTLTQFFKVRQLRKEGEADADANGLQLVWLSWIAELAGAAERLARKADRKELGCTQSQGQH